MQYSQFKLKDLLEIKNGTDYRNIEIGKIPVYGSGGYMTSINQYLYDKESILLPRKGTLNNIMYVTGKFWTVDTMYWSIINKHIVLPNYLYYYLKTLNYDNLYSGSTLPSMTNSAYYSIPIKLPTLEYQKKLAYTLEIIDKKIELNNKINSELENIAKTLYEYWFVQFDFPDENERPYKSSGGKMKKSSILNKYIPENWNEGKLFDYIENDKGGDWGKDNPQGSYSLKVRCFRGADIPTMNTCCISDAPIRYINKNNSFKILNNNDIVIEISGGSPIQSTGRIAYINSELLNKYGLNLITSNFCKAISLKSLKYVYNFYLEWQALYNQGVFFNYEGKTTGIKNLLYDDFINSYNTVIPDEDTITKFYQIVSPIFNQIQRNCKEAINLIQIREYLLPMLMNGQVTIPQ